MSVSRGSDGWIELNVTKGVEGILPQMKIKNYTDIHVIIKAKVDCNNQKKVPFYLINPAEIPLDQVIRRERQMDNQPFLVVFGDNEETKEALRKEKVEEVIGPGVDDRSELVNDGPWKRSVPNHSTSSCQKSDFILDLRELRLSLDFTVLFPRSLNIFKCSGTCNDDHLIFGRGTNHARIMTIFYNQQTLESSGEPVTTTFCCAPTKYGSVDLLLMFSLDNIAIVPFIHSVVKECGCI